VEEREMSRRFLLLACLLFPGGVAAQSQSTEVTVRIHSLERITRLHISPAGGDLRARLCADCKAIGVTQTMEVELADGKLRVGSLGEPTAQAEITGAYRLEISGGALPRSSYPLTLRGGEDGIRLLARMPLEEYVAAVLAGESPNFKSDEALAAMAVAVRSFAAHERGRHQAEGADFCDSTHCQVFRPEKVTPRLRAAVDSTEGELLWYAGRPAETYYHRHCGGTTEGAEWAWSGPKVAYLKQQSDTYCVVHGRDEWQAEVTKEELRRALASAGMNPPAQIHGLAVSSRTPSGRVRQVRVSGSATLAVDGNVFRRAVGQAVGWDRLRSNLYDARDAGDRIVFHGYGAGHGVGLCQTGADEMGVEGKNHAEILRYYFPGTTLGMTAQGLAWQSLRGERVEMLTTRAHEDEALIAIAERLLREEESRTGWRLEQRPLLKVYPSVAVFRDATGLPGWVAARTYGRVVKIQPAEVLRSAGTLEQTLRHELLHQLVESHARQGLPEWFREGIVLALAGGAADVETANSFRDAAALELALTRPRSNEEAQAAYAAARARVRALIAKHGQATVLSWVERGLPPEVTKR
jgi:stage II sporulation protein D